VIARSEDRVVGGAVWRPRATSWSGVRTRLWMRA